LFHESQIMLKLLELPDVPMAAAAAAALYTCIMDGIAVRCTFCHSYCCSRCQLQHTTCQHLIMCSRVLAEKLGLAAP
jgi:hypothetical protein